MATSSSNKAQDFYGPAYIDKLNKEKKYSMILRGEGIRQISSRPKQRPLPVVRVTAGQTVQTVGGLFAKQPSQIYVKKGKRIARTPRITYSGQTAKSGVQSIGSKTKNIFGF